MEARVASVKKARCSLQELFDQEIELDAAQGWEDLSHAQELVDEELRAGYVRVPFAETDALPVQS